MSEVVSELIDRLNEYRSMGDKFYPEDIVITEDIWLLIGEIERLNNIINELEKYIHNELVLDFYNDDMPCELIINKMENMIKKLKGDSSNE